MRLVNDYGLHRPSFPAIICRDGRIRRVDLHQRLQEVWRLLVEHDGSVAVDVCGRGPDEIRHALDSRAPLCEGRCSGQVAGLSCDSSVGGSARRPDYSAGFASVCECTHLKAGL